MLAILAALAFVIAIVLSETGGDLVLNYGGWIALGLLLLALHAVVPVTPPWNR